MAKVEEAPSSAPPPPPPPVGSAAIAGEVPTDVPPPPPPPPPLGEVHDLPKPPVVIDGWERVPVAHGGYKRRRVGEAEASWQYMYLCEHKNKVEVTCIHVVCTKILKVVPSRNKGLVCSDL